ncbi:MAG: MBOAT family protein [Clostridiales bacterium]|nr:MBOAT family protein [Clostridiales bacterium]
MVFSSVSFLYFFLPVTLMVYYAVPRKWISGKNAVLLLASLFFYFWGEQLLVLVMLASAAIDYVNGLVIEKYRQSKVIPQIMLGVSVATNIALLGYFKYFNFFAENFSSFFGIDYRIAQIALPIGISFYTFQTLSYTIDVYRGNLKAQKNPVAYATFVTMFPQLVAGPIVRYSEVEKELAGRRNTFAGFSDGVRRFIIGLAKKVLIANVMADLAQTIAASGESTVLFAWMSVLAFFFQIYFDFSGYSDMAIGLGKMFGFKFPENFNYPYTARSVSDFWRRWHMTLTRWFRDYIYIPLGGNRSSKGKLLRNIAVVWLLTGLWHGAAWNFIAWGAYFAVILTAEKFIWGRHLEKAPKAAGHIYTLFLVLFGWVLFSAGGLGEAWRNLSAMFGGGGIPFAGEQTWYYLRSYAFVFVFAVIGSTPLLKNLCGRLKNGKTNGGSGSPPSSEGQAASADMLRQEKRAKVMNALEPLFLAALLIIVTAFLVDGSFNPFIYFRF